MGRVVEVEPAAWGGVMDGPARSAGLRTERLQSVDNALRVLLLLRNRSMRLSDIADELGVARSTAHRLVSTLVHRGFVTQDASARTYRTGEVLLEIAAGALAARDLRALARPHLHALRDELEETAHLIALEGRMARFVDGIEGLRGVRVGSRIGLRLPAYSTSGGKALLACLDDRTVEAMYPANLRGMTDETVPTRQALIGELATIRKQGYAYNLGESEAKVMAVGAAVRGPTGHPLVAVVVAARGEWLRDSVLATAGNRVAGAAAAISSEIAGGVRAQA